jgi:hypothetical protein
MAILMVADPVRDDLPGGNVFNGCQLPDGAPIHAPTEASHVRWDCIREARTCFLETG